MTREKLEERFKAELDVIDGYINGFKAAAKIALDEFDKEKASEGGSNGTTPPAGN